MMEIRLPKMEKWQMDVYDAVMSDGDDRTFVIKSKRQVGKSVLASILLIARALTNKCTSILVEPTLNQSRRMYKDIMSMLNGSGAITSANASILSLELANGSEILFKSHAQGTDAIRGFTVSKGGLLIVDEGAFISEDYYEVLFPVRDANRADMVLFSTPMFAEGMYYRLYNDPSSITFDWAEYDTSKFLSAERLEYYRQRLPDMRFRSEYLAEFIMNGGYVFRTYSFSNSKKRPVVAGVDWGSGQGQDYTFVTFLDEDGQTTSIFYDNTLSPVECVDKVSSLLNGSGIKRVEVEENSIGAVYKDMLQRALDKGIELQTFNTTNATKRELIEDLNKALSSGACTVYEDDELKTQIQAYAMERLPSGAYTYNASRGHDDGVMSLAIAYHCLTKRKGGYVLSAPVVSRERLRGRNRNKLTSICIRT